MEGVVVERGSVEPIGTYEGSGSSSSSSSSSNLAGEASRKTKQPVGLGDAADKEVIREVSVCGVPTHPWEVMEPIFERSILLCLDGFRMNERKESVGARDYELRRNELVELLRGFFGAPFTIQRISELILEPGAHYKTLDALLRGFEMLLSVSSTVPVASPEEVERLRREYSRVVSSAMPGRSLDGRVLKRSDTIDMEMDMS